MSSRNDYRTTRFDLFNRPADFTVEQEVHSLKIPIDEWKEFVKNTVGKDEDKW